MSDGGHERTESEKLFGLERGSAMEQQKSPFRNFLLKSYTLLDSYCYWIGKFLGIHGVERTELVTISSSYRTDNPCFPLKLLQNTCTFPNIFSLRWETLNTHTLHPVHQKRITLTHEGVHEYPGEMKTKCFQK